MFTLKNGDVIKDYKIIEKFELGKNVYLVSKLSSNDNFVMKFLEGGIVNEEVKIGMTLGLKCPYLVRMFEMNVVKDKDIYVIMEHCREGDLSKRIEKKTLPTDIEIYCFTYQATKAIHTLHEAGIIHRDIKSSNFFVKDGGFKLGDYGVACHLDSAPSKTMTQVGTNGYTSPEILEGRKVYTNKVDIYSFGITLLEFILGIHPFSNTDGGFNLLMAMKGVPIDAALKHPHPCAKLALRMIALDPVVRPSTAEILATEMMAVCESFVVPMRTLQQENNRLRAAAEAAATAEGGMAVGVSSRLELQDCTKSDGRRGAGGGSGSGVGEGGGDGREKKASSSPPVLEEKIVFGPKESLSQITISQSKVNFRNKEHTIFIECNLSLGRIYVLDVSVVGYIGVGLALKTEFPRLKSKFISQRKACALHFWTIWNGGKTLGKLNNWNAVSSTPTSVRLEFNTDTRTLYFFVKGSQLPYSITDIPSDVYFVVSSSGSVHPEADVHSLRSVPATATTTTNSRLACAEYRWNS